MNEIRAYINYANLGGTLSFWRTPHGAEVDLIYESARNKNERIGFEFKTSIRWKSEFSSVLNDLLDSGILSQAYGVFLGENPQKVGKLHIFNCELFLERLWNGKILT